ncbi:MAG: CHAP domain-containing protein [bacterium]|nr:CHAP domain-containing protein [bacterium]
MVLVCWIIFLFSATEIIAAPCESYQDCGQSASGNYGCVIGSYRNVGAKSNGDWTGDGCGIYQCVEYVKRFFSTAMYFNTSSWSGNGNQYYGSAESKGLRVFDQDGTVKPKEGDILCFGGGPSGYGHVAIITSVSTSSITIIDQNRHASNPFKSLSLTETSGHYEVEDIGTLYVQGWLRGYASEYDSQNPNTMVTMTPGEARLFIVKFGNSSRPNAPNWTNDNSGHNVELHSCNSSGAEVASFLRPVDGKPAWLDPTNRIRIVKMYNTDVDTDEIGEFQFWGKVPATATPGDYQVYFRPYHGAGGLMENWGNMNFYIRVVNPNLVGNNFIAFTGNFNGDGEADIGLWDTLNGNWYIALSNTNNNTFVPEVNAWLTDWADGGGYQLLVGDFSGDGYDDLCVYHHTTGKWFVAYNQFNGSRSFVSDGLWLDNWRAGDADDWVPFVGDFSGDGYDDVGVYQPANGRWYVAYNNGGYFSQANGSDVSYSWLSGWGTGSYNTYLPFVGKLVGNDVYQDVGLYHPVTGRWFVAGNNKQPDHFASNGLWLDGWATGSYGTWKHFCGKSSVDNYDDIIVYRPSDGKWCVAYNWATYFAQANGAGANGAWLTGWAVEANDLNWQTFTADVSGDGYVDLIAYTPKHGRWFVAYNWAGPPPYFASANGPSTNSSWLTGWGIITGGTPKVINDNENEILPTLFTLSQNYPNPFNPVTTIQYSLPEATQVTLDIFNILGQKVTTLVNEHQEAGEYSISWDAQKQASGIYFYHLVTGEAVETKKMVLLK